MTTQNRAVFDIDPAAKDLRLDALGLQFRLPAAQIGETVMLRAARDADAVVVGANSAVIARLMTSRSKTGTLDAGAMQAIATNGDLWRLDSRTRARVLNMQTTEAGDTYQVQVVAGPSQGGTAWVESSSME